MNSLAQLQATALAEIKWAVGVDAHKQSFTYILLETGLYGGVKAQGDLPNTQAGYAQLLSRLKECECESGLVFAVENARGYGLGLSWYLLAQGQWVYDIPATEIAHLRKRRQRVKSDFEDARQAVTALLDSGLWAKRAPLRLSTTALQIQSLERSRESLVGQRVAIGQQIEALATQPYALPQVKASLEAVCTAIKQQIGELEKTLRELLEPYQALQNASGIGLVTAAVLIGEAQDMQRFRSEAAFASYAGVAPKDHSSANNQRVKVNPGGNRRLNRAIEFITWNRLKRDSDTRAYRDSKRKAGMSARQATRATKRQVCRSVYRTLCQVLT